MPGHSPEDGYDSVERYPSLPLSLSPHRFDGLALSASALHHLAEPYNYTSSSTPHIVLLQLHYRMRSSSIAISWHRCAPPFFKRSSIPLKRSSWKRVCWSLFRLKVKVYTLPRGNKSGMLATAVEWFRRLMLHYDISVGLWQTMLISYVVSFVYCCANDVIFRLVQQIVEFNIHLISMTYGFLERLYVAGMIYAH